MSICSAFFNGAPGIEPVTSGLQNRRRASHRFPSFPDLAWSSRAARSSLAAFPPSLASPFQIRSKDRAEPVTPVCSRAGCYPWCSPAAQEERDFARRGWPVRTLRPYPCDEFSTRERSYWHDNADARNRRGRDRLRRPVSSPAPGSRAWERTAISGWSSRSSAAPRATARSRTRDPDVWDAATNSTMTRVPRPTSVFRTTYEN
jgi:hypothetical protein